MKADDFHQDDNENVSDSDFDEEGPPNTDRPMIRNDQEDDDVIISPEDVMV